MDEQTGRGPRPLLWREAAGHALRQERLRQHRTLAGTAADAGISTQYLSEVERGRKEASSEILEAVAEALGLDLTALARRVADLAATAVERPVLTLVSGTGGQPGATPRATGPVLLAV